MRCRRSGTIAGEDSWRLRWRTGSGGLGSEFWGVVGDDSDDGDGDEISMTRDLGCYGSAVRAEEEFGGGDVEDLSEGEEIKRRRRNPATDEVGEPSGKDFDALVRAMKPR